MKCNRCKNEWSLPPIQSSPHGEYGCLKTGNSLEGVIPEEVENCSYFEPGDNEYLEDFKEWEKDRC